MTQNSEDSDNEKNIKEDSQFNGESVDNKIYTSQRNFRT